MPSYIAEAIGVEAGWLPRPGQQPRLVKIRLHEPNQRIVGLHGSMDRMTWNGGLGRIRN